MPIEQQIKMNQQRASNYIKILLKKARRGKKNSSV